jgi:hypothetical protein
MRLARAVSRQALLSELVWRETPVANRTLEDASSAETVASLMRELKADLARLVAITSVSGAGYPEATRPRLLEPRARPRRV